MIAITITRIVGIKWQGKLDSVWETFYTLVPAEIGLTLVAVTAFRTLFVAKSGNRHVQDTITTFHWYDSGRSAALRLYSRITRRTSKKDHGSIEIPETNGGFFRNDIPRAKLTGVQTFIDQHGNSSITSSKLDGSMISAVDVEFPGRLESPSDRFSYSLH